MSGCAQGKEVIPADDTVVVAEVAPPPLSGGTLIVSRDEARAIAADPDRDVVWIVDLERKAHERTIALQPGDEPGRLVEDAAGRVHVALRRGGALVTLDPSTGEILHRIPVCAAPRGVAFQETTGQVHVACAGGELVSVDAATGAEARRVALDIDLRDVVALGDRLVVTRFRSAEVLSLDAEGKVVSRAVPPAVIVPVAFDVGAGGSGPGAVLDARFAPGVAWRTIALGTGEVLMVHQRANIDEIELDEPGGYGEGEGGCDPIVHGALSRFGVAEDGTLLPPDEALTRIPGGVQVDVAATADGSRLAVAAPGTWQALVGSDLELSYAADEACGFGGGAGLGSVSSVAFRGREAVAQLRDYPAIVILEEGTLEPTWIELPGEQRLDSGYNLFHLFPGLAALAEDFGDADKGFGAALACASCHPEGGEDGHVWNFRGAGPRRTQSLRGGILATAPLHWEGDMGDMGAIMREVFERRMGAPSPGPVRASAIAHWVDAIPPLPGPRSPSDPAAARGRALFESESVGCVKCHSGPRFTNNETMSVGKGEALQVPSLLGVAWRAPFMHDGCAATLRDRFDPACGGADHGDVSGLTEADIADLIAYLETL